MQTKLILVVALGATLLAPLATAYHDSTGYGADAGAATREGGYGSCDYTDDYYYSRTDAQGSVQVGSRWIELYATNYCNTWRYNSTQYSYSRTSLGIETWDSSSYEDTEFYVTWWQYERAGESSSYRYCNTYSHVDAEDDAYRYDHFGCPIGSPRIFQLP